MNEEGFGVDEIEDPLKQFREEWEAYKKERNDRLHRFFVRILVIFALLGLTVSATVYYVYTSSETNKEALCAIRHDAERRVFLGEQFLKEHPNGIAGISANSLRVSLNNSKETVESLSSLNCVPVTMPERTPDPRESP